MEHDSKKHKEQDTPVPGTVVGGHTDTASPILPGTEREVGSQKKKTGQKGWMTLLMIIGILLAVGSLSAAAYFGFYVPRQPENILARAVGNTINQETVASGQIEGAITVEGSGQDQALTVTFEGASNGKDSELSVDAKAGDANLAADIKRIDHDLYFQVDGLTNIKNIVPFLNENADNAAATAFQSLLATFNKQWVFIDDSQLKENESTQDLAAVETIKAEDAQAVIDAYKKYPFLDVTNVFPNEAIHNQSSYHYEVKFNKQNLQSFLEELRKQNIEGLPKITQNDINAIGNSSIDTWPFEVWIDKSRNVVDQVSFTWTGDNLNGDPMEITIRAALFNINQPVTITKPSGTKTLQQLFVGSSLEALGATGALSSELDAVAR